MKKIMFTGGGSAGHVTVNMALIPYFTKEDWSIVYVGSYQGIEHQLMEQFRTVQYVGISTGKLRRYAAWENVKDPFRILKGTYEAYRTMKNHRPSILFSKGGFVSVPVVIAAWLNRIPVIIHESDLTPGLANRISIPFAKKVCTTFKEASLNVSSSKAVHVGAIIREELRHGQKSRGYSFCDFVSSKPVMLIMGGSLGSRVINETVRRSLPQLLQDYQIIHICGKGQVDSAYAQRGYKQVEYVHEELADLFAIADFVVSRAGSNSIFEFLALCKPMLLIPLSKQASRGDQILNAEAFQRAGYCEILQEEQLTEQQLVQSIQKLVHQKDTMIERMKSYNLQHAVEQIIQLIESTSKDA